MSKFKLPCFLIENLPDSELPRTKTPVSIAVKDLTILDHIVKRAISSVCPPEVIAKRLGAEKGSRLRRIVLCVCWILNTPDVASAMEFFDYLNSRALTSSPQVIVRELQIPSRNWLSQFIFDVCAVLRQTDPQKALRKNVGKLKTRSNSLRISLKWHSNPSR